MNAAAKKKHLVDELDSLAATRAYELYEVDMEKAELAAASIQVRTRDDLIDHFAIRITFQGHQAVVQMDDSLAEVMGEKEYNLFRQQVFRAAAAREDEWRREEEERRKEEEEKRRREQEEKAEKERLELERILATIKALAEALPEAASKAKLRDVLISDGRSGARIDEASMRIRFELEDLPGGIGSAVMDYHTRLSALSGAIDLSSSVIEGALSAWSSNEGRGVRREERDEMTRQCRTALQKKAPAIRRAMKGARFSEKVERAATLEALRCTRRFLRAAIRDMMILNSHEAASAEISDMVGEEIARKVLES